MTIKRFAFIFSLALFLWSCDKDPLNVDTSSVDLSVSYARFDDAFFGAPIETLENELPQLRRDFPEFFLVDQSTDEWLEVRKDPYLNMLYSKVSRIYPDLSALRPDVESALEHYKYYFPNTPSNARVITYVSGLDWEFPVIAADSVYFISLDMFLGPDTVYDQWPNYLASRFSPEYFPAKFARQLAEPVVSIDRGNGSFLSQILYEGRVLYLMEAILPQAEKHILIEYTADELNWCKQNEQEVWTFFVEQELLFSNDNGLYDRFIAEAPFSKFYKKIDRESPGRIGRWIGWQIVRSYMKAHPETTVPELARMNDSQLLFKNAQYKPLK